MDKNSILDFFEKTKELIVPKNEQSFKVSRENITEFMQPVSEREGCELNINISVTNNDCVKDKVFKGIAEEFSTPIYHSVSADINLILLAEKNREHYNYFEALLIARTAMLTGETDGNKALIIYFRVEEIDTVFYFTVSRYNGGKLHLDQDEMFSGDEFDHEYYNFCFK